MRISSVLSVLFEVACLAHQSPLLPGQERFQWKHDAASSTFGSASFDRLVEEILKAWHVPGLSMAVVDKNTISSKGYGIAVLPSTKATPDTLYFTGSTTKAFTAAAAAVLIENQDVLPGLKWTTPINKLIREDFVLSDDYATTHVTIEDALSHRTGMPRNDLSYGRDDTPSSVVRSLRHLPMTRELRTTFQYCNMMYAVVTEVLENLTGLKLETIFREKFWEPLGMASTSFNSTFLVEAGQSASHRTVARGYWWGPNQAKSSRTRSTPIQESKTSSYQYIPEPYIDLSCISGAGAIVSNVNDYALWIKAWLEAAKGGETNKSSPVTRSVYQSLLSPRTIFPAPADPSVSNLFINPQLYALGWASSTAMGHLMVGHTGGLTGFGANVIFLPDDDYGIVSMGNTALTSNIVGSIIASVLLQKRLGIKDEDQASFHAAVHEILHTQGALKDQTVQFRKPLIARPASEYGVASKLPLPGDIGDYSGIYTHPAYGEMNLTVGQTSSLDDLSPPPLNGIPPMTTWRYKFDLHYDTDTLFKVKFYVPHGIEEDKIVWEYAGSGRAVFQFGPPRAGAEMLVETMGIEIEAEMVDAARNGENSGKSWKDGMIWFEKV